MSRGAPAVIAVCARFGAARWRRPLAILSVLCATACASAGGAAALDQPVAAREWPGLLGRAQIAVTERRYADAEHQLADFAARYPGSEQAHEATFWQGLFRLDPANPDASPAAAVAWLDSYLKPEGPRSHRSEADVLRRLASRLDSLTSANAAAAPAAPAPAATDRSAELKAKDAEIQRLKEELAKANDELERIKRRLTAPTKP